MSQDALVTLLRQWLAGRPWTAPTPSPVPAALDHRLAGTLYHIRAPLSELDTQRCQAAWATNLAAHLLRLEVLSRHWPREAPPPLVFKGADLAEHLYDDPGAREARDLDLMVPPAAFGGLVRHLARHADAVERPRHERFPTDPEHAAGLRFGPVLIELHAHPWPPHRGGPPGWTWWARGRPGSLGEVAVLYPAPADRLALWLGNLAKGGFRPDLADMLDFALISRRCDDTSTVEAAGLGAALRLARAHAARLGWGPHRGRASALVGPLVGPLGTPAPRRDGGRLQAQVVKTCLAPLSAQPAILARLAASALARLRGGSP